MNYNILIYSAIFIIFLAPSLAFAQTDEMFWGGYENDFQTITGLGDNDPRIMIASLINLALGFMGILMLLIILLAGFKWMLSMGSEEKASEARSMLVSGVIGLIIIFASFALAQFAVNMIYEATLGIV